MTFPDGALAVVGLQPALGIDGGHAPRAGGGDGLPVGVVLDVAAGEHAAGSGCMAAIDAERWLEANHEAPADVNETPTEW